jgi:alkylation response protein AidB-like acyl-CoA dehydrogenase
MTAPRDLAATLAQVRAFVDDELIPAEAALWENDSNAHQLMESLKESAKRQRIWALGHPERLGGGGLSFLDMVHLNGVVGRSTFGQTALGTRSMQDSIMLDRFGSTQQKEKWLRGLASGDVRTAIAMTEPAVAGSDPTQMQTRADLDGDEWVINGRKWFTTGANIATYATVLALTDPDAEKYRAYSAIIVPTDTPGWELVRVIPTMGRTTGNHCEVELRDVRVPRDNVLGERGQGLHIAQDRLGPGRIFHCMRWLGQAYRAFDLLCARANSRYAHGSLLADKGEIQRWIAESAADIEAHRLMTLEAAYALDAGKDASVLISLIKFRGAQMLHTVIDRAIQVHGAMGVTSDTPLEAMYREARYARIYDGPDEVHRMRVAKRLLKNPALAPWESADLVPFGSGLSTGVSHVW